jgi:putative DNA primase/helicase
MTGCSPDLRSRARALGGEVTGGQVLAPGPGHSHTDRSLSVRLDAHAREGFRAFSFAGDDWRVCRDHIRERLGIAHQPQKLNQHAVRPLLTAGQGKREVLIREMIEGIARQLVPLRGTPGERYLAETRRIDTAAIADVLERVDAIGWHRSVLFRGEGHSLDGKRLGCIVGVMTDPTTAKPTGAISRTYIHEGRKIGKAKMLGSPVGIVRLSADEGVLLGLHLAEGLETALAAMAKGFRPVWSTGSAGIMAAFPVLLGVEAVTLFADNDVSGTGLHAANEAAARWRAAGRKTHIYLRNALGDFNDVLLETAR